MAANSPYYSGGASRVAIASAAAPSLVEGQLTSLSIDDNGNLRVTTAGGGGGGTSSSFGSPLPATGTAAGVEDPSGDMVALQVDGSGNLKVAGSLTVTPITSTAASVPAVNTVGTTAEVAIAANANRKRLVLVNAGTTALKYYLGASDPDQDNYHFAQPAGGSANDGSRAPYIDDMWKGEVRVISDAAGGLCLASELT